MSWLPSPRGSVGGDTASRGRCETGSSRRTLVLMTAGQEGHSGVLQWPRLGGAERPPPSIGADATGAHGQPPARQRAMSDLQSARWARPLPATPRVPGPPPRSPGPRGREPSQCHCHPRASAAPLKTPFGKRVPWENVLRSPSPSVSGWPGRGPSSPGRAGGPALGLRSAGDVVCSGLARASGQPDGRLLVSGNAT